MKSTICGRILNWLFGAAVTLSINWSAAYAQQNQSLADPIVRLGRLGVEEIIFAERKNSVGDGHWYSNLGYCSDGPQSPRYNVGGRLCKLNLKNGGVVALIDDPAGGIRDPQVHYDAKKIIVSYRKGGTAQYHLYEINVDGTGLRQLTDGIYDDIEPSYLPDGGIVFASTRGKRWVNCWKTQVANIYRCDADGGNVRMLSPNLEQDNTPWVLPDGRILYTRWEYVDRSQVQFHHLWTMNPDGASQQIFFGNMHPGSVFIDAKPIPGSHKIVLVNSPGHGRHDHTGALAVVSDAKGPDDKTMLVDFRKTPDNRDPYALDTETFLAADDTGIILVNAHGETVTLYKSEKNVQEPRPLIRHPRERVIPSKIDLTKKTGTLVLTNAYFGRNMDGVKPGEIKTLLILESLPKPINYGGNKLDFVPISWGGSFTLERILGTVPVEADGSAQFEVPAGRALILAALDEKNSVVKRMQSFLTVMPGETLSCLGCHEQRVKTQSPPTGNLTAARRPPSTITPVAGIPELFDYPKDIQPIWDRHCVSCHSSTKFAGGLDLSDGHGVVYSLSFFNLFYKKLITDGRNGVGNRAPRSIWDSASRLMGYLNGSHHKATLTPLEVEKIRFWINAGAPYIGTYAALGTGMLHNRYSIDPPGITIPEVKDGEAVFNRRCLSCHRDTTVTKKDKKLETVCGIDSPLSIRDFQSGSARPTMQHRIYNLSHPENSLALLAPLSPTAGGLGMLKKGKNGKADERIAVFTDTHDPDYQLLLGMVKACQAYLEKDKRWDMPGFKPNSDYVREMKRYGIIPESFDPEKDTLDGYATDQKYWRSLWYYPPGEEPTLFKNPETMAKFRLAATDAKAEPSTPVVARPPFVFACEGAEKIMEFDAAGKLAWEYPALMAREVWRLPNGNTLFTYNEQYGVLSDKENPCGVREVTRDKKVVFEYHAKGQLFSCQRLADGNTLVALAGQGKIQTVNPAGQVVREFQVKNKPGHSCMRNARQLANGNILVAEESAHAAREYTADGKLVREFPVPFAAYSALRTGAGETIVCGQQELIRFDRDGKNVWNIRGNDIPEMGVRWFSGIQLLPDGSIFVSNAGGKVPFFMVSRAKQVVWHSEPDTQKYPKGHGVQLLNQAWPPQK